MSRPVIVGEMNPWGADPYYAMYPSPDGCSGHRLCGLILGMRRTAYLESFQRVNLCVGKWSIRAARSEASRLIHAGDNGGRFILCGSKVAQAFGLDFAPFCEVDGGRERFLILPHPSGLNRLWNEDDAFEKARRTVLELCPELKDVVGVA